MVSDIIRKGFKELRDTGFDISAQQLLTMMESTGCKPPVRGLGISNFTVLRDQCVNDHTIPKPIEPSPENARALRTFFEQTLLGRALRQPKPDVAAGQSRIIDALSKPTLDGERYAGLWFVLHGSYLKKNHLAVHLMKVTYSREGVLDVTDTIRNTLSIYRKPLRSAGIMNLFNGLPHIITYGDENRIGFSLFVAAEGDTDDGKPNEMLVRGILTGMTKDSIPFTRKAALVKWASPPEDEKQLKSYSALENKLIELSGIFSKEEIDDPIRKSGHKAAQMISDRFRDLNDWQHDRAIPDPLSKGRKLVSHKKAKDDQV